ncbi:MULTISPECIES: WYL domain-containing protein [unclassified Endozoicomonas]|uniref:WYL domain-containing protein n=1 Tax=unclassified Endozoicomonas TaxID=2644528 RepID=UPI003BB70CBC
MVSLIDRLGLKKALPHKTARFLINFVNQNTGGCYHFQEAPLEMDFIESLHTLIEKAIQSKREVQFLYKNKTRKVNPYMMVFYRGSWYLAATAEGVLKAFSLARIKLASLGNEHFAIDEAIIKQIKEHDSVWFGQPEFEVTLEVHPDVAFFFERKALLPRQEILEKKPDGTLIIRACAWSYSQIVPLVQSWIPNIKVISPRKLHQHIQQNFTQWLASSGNISD